MQFKDIKQNYPVYILNKQDMSVTQGKVTAVSFSRMEMDQKTGKSQMVIDVTIEANGSTATYTIPDNLSVTYANLLVLSTDKQGLSNEIEAMKTLAEQIIASVPQQKEIVAKATELLAELNPIYKEKAETEKRFGAIEGTISDMKGSMDEMKAMMTEFIKKLS